MSKPTYKIPYSEKGNMLYAGHNWPRAHEWCDPEPFEAKMRVLEWGSKESSYADFTLKDFKTGLTYPMTPSNFALMLARVNIFAGDIDGMHTWLPVKMGTRYSLKLIR